MRRRVSVIVPDRQGNVLVDDKPGDVEIPGGGIEEGESVEEAAVREVMEEAGLRPVDVKSFEQRPTVADGQKTYWRKAEGVVSDKRLYNVEGDGMQRTKYMPKPELKKKIQESDEHPEVKEDEQMAIEKLSYSLGLSRALQASGIKMAEDGIKRPISAGRASDPQGLPYSPGYGVSGVADRAKGVAKNMAKKKGPEPKSTTSGPGGTTLAKRKGGPGGSTT